MVPWSIRLASGGGKRTYNISELEDTPENRKKIFYKQKLLEEYDEERDITFDQTLIVTYSLKYKLYQQTVRSRPIERAKNILNTRQNQGAFSYLFYISNDYTRTSITDVLHENAGFRTDYEI